MNCKTPGCTNPRAPKRRKCTVCVNRQRGEAAKRDRQRRQRVKGYGPCCPTCPGWLDCTSRRTDDPRTLPCETLLPDEVGKVYDSNEISLRIWPSMVRL